MVIELASPAELDSAYQHCRKLTARHGKTFYLATGLLPAAARPHVHALYGFARYADDLVDQPESALPDVGSDVITAPAARLAVLAAELDAALDPALETGVDASAALHGGPADGPVTNPVVRAVSATARRFGIDRRYFTDFLAAMTADLTVARYADFEQLLGYMWGSASVIGLQLLPILGVAGDRELAERCASELGIAFQLTNFLRDVGEDYQRGRIYLPQDTLARHRVSEQMFTGRRTAPELKAALAAEIDRARGYYRSARPGIELLAPQARDCIRTAATLYGEILDEIERSDYEVLAQRARVSRRRRLAVGLAGYLGAVRARRAPSRTA